jgi:hypothetical protein
MDERHARKPTNRKEHIIHVLTIVPVIQTDETLRLNQGSQDRLPPRP